MLYISEVSLRLFQSKFGHLKFKATTLARKSGGNIPRCAVKFAREKSQRLKAK
jgi:hypothetical protein